MKFNEIVALLNKPLTLGTKQADRVKRLADIVTPDQQPPVLSFKQDGTTYTFESPDDEGTSVEEIVNETSVITLGPDGKALYGWQWNKKTDEQEAEEQ